MYRKIILCAGMLAILFTIVCCSEKPQTSTEVIQDESAPHDQQAATQDDGEASHDESPGHDEGGEAAHGEDPELEQTASQRV